MFQNLHLNCPHNFESLRTGICFEQTHTSGSPLCYYLKKPRPITSGTTYTTAPPIAIPALFVPHCFSYLFVVRLNAILDIKVNLHFQSYALFFPTYVTDPHARFEIGRCFLTYSLSKQNCTGKQKQLQKQTTTPV